MKTFPSALALSLLAASALSADVIVNWGGDYSVASPGSQRGTAGNSATLDYYGNSGAFNQRAWSEATLLNPSSDYTGTPYYGGGFNSYTAATPGGFLSSTYGGIQHNAAGDRIYYRSQAPGVADMTQRNGAIGVAFLQSDWDALSAETAIFDASSSLSMNIQINNANVTWRFIVKEGAQWYVSNASYTGNGTKTLDAASPTPLLDMTWAAWSPTASLDFDAAATFASVPFANITGVGYHGEFGFATAGANTTAQDLVVQGFTANLAIIPEPGTAALVGLSFAALFALGRRRRP
jgi:hypothetical protein